MFTNPFGTTTYDVIMIFVSIAIFFYTIFCAPKLWKENEKKGKILSKRLKNISIAMFVCSVIDFIFNFFKVW